MIIRFTSRGNVFALGVALKPDDADLLYCRPSVKAVWSPADADEGLLNLSLRGITSLGHTVGMDAASSHRHYNTHFAKQTTPGKWRKCLGHFDVAIIKHDTELPLFSMQYEFRPNYVPNIQYEHSWEAVETLLHNYHQNALTGYNQEAHEVKPSKPWWHRFAGEGK